MGYIGSQPATNFETVRKQVSTTNSGTTITLDYSVSSVQDILVTVNAVVQSYDNYSVSGTTLTLGGTLNNDRVEILYVGRTFQTVSPAVGTVTNDMLVNSSITLNGSAVSLGGSATVDNTPMWFVRKTVDQSLPDNSYTKITWNSEVIDTDSAFASDKFTVPSGKAGKYYISTGVGFYDNSTQQYHYVLIYKNGSNVSANPSGITTTSNDTNRYWQTNNMIVDLAVGDYIEVYALIKCTSGTSTSNYSYFTGYKLIT